MMLSLVTTLAFSVLQMGLPTKQEAIACQIGVGMDGNMYCAEPTVQFKAQPWRDVYSCYYMFGHCGRSANGKCEWAATQELAGCVQQPASYRNAYNEWKRRNYLSPIDPEQQMKVVEELNALLHQRSTNIQQPQQRILPPASATSQEGNHTRQVIRSQPVIRSPQPIVIHR